MKLDCRGCPVGYTYAEVASKALGIYVSVADFHRIGERQTFRMIVDAEMTREQLKELLTSSVRDANDVYTFYQIESIVGPIVDQSPRPSANTNYLRITFM